MTAGGSLTCDSCGAARDEGFGPCSACGAVRGQDNRCPSCQAIAAVREEAPGRYACLACGAPRTLQPHTHVSLDYVGELEGLARMAKLTSRISYALAMIVGVGTLALAGLLSIASGTAALVPLVLGGGVTTAAALFARAKGRAAAQAQQDAAHRRLLSAVRATDTGVTVQAATRAVRVPSQEVDAMLTDMARKGTLDMDVDDEGTIRYRIAERFDDEALPDAESTAAAERSATD